MKNYSKIALIRSNPKPSWISSQSIRSNIIESYTQSFPNSKIFSYQLNTNSEHKLVQRLARFKPEKLVFVESNPTPKFLVDQILKSNFFKSVEFCFHLYGDFSLFTPDWKEIFDKLEGQPTAIVLASASQKGQVSEVFKKSKKGTNLIQCQFPIDNERFRVLNNRQQIRSKFGIKKKDFAIIYSGRICRQKGFPLVLNWLDEVARKNKLDNLKFIISGNFDDCGTPLWGKIDPKGTAFLSAYETLNKLSPTLKGKVSFVGNKPSGELIELYNSADLFVSLSTFHDEDFGMSPLESLMCGTPAILSSWGGFNSFQMNRLDIRYVETKIGINSINLNFRDFENAIKYYVRSQKNNSNLRVRKQRHSRYSKKYSIKAVAKILAKIHSKDFFPLQGTNDTLAYHALVLKLMRLYQIPPYTSASKQDKLYYRLYRHYTSGR